MRFSATSSLISGLVFIIPTAIAQEQLWLTQFGTLPGHDDAWAVATDGAGGVYLAGDTTDSLGGSSAGGIDAYVARYDSTGVQLWIRQFGTSASDNPRALAPDVEGGVYVAGRTGGDLAGPSAGRLDAFLALYDATGDQVWVRQFGSIQDEYPYALTPDGTGGVFLAGHSRGILGPGRVGGYDGFLARYDHTGVQLWIRQFGSERLDYAYALASDGAGGCFVAGATRGDFGGPNVGPHNSHDAFVARFDESGQQLWVRQFGTDLNDAARGAATDGRGGVYVGGWTQGSLAGINAGVRDAYVAHFDGAGNRTWIDQFGTGGFDNVRTLLFDGSIGVYVAGDTVGSLGGPHLSPNSPDVFLARYDRFGHQLWIDQFGTTGSDYARGLATDGLNGFYVGGSLDGAFENAFLARYAVDRCYADCDQSTGFSILDIFDFLCFQNSFVSGEPYACDCDPNRACDIFDFLCFQNAFVAGCP